MLLNIWFFIFCVLIFAAVIFMNMLCIFVFEAFSRRRITPYVPMAIAIFIVWWLCVVFIQDICVTKLHFCQMNEGVNHG